MAERGPRSVIERAENGNSRPPVVRTCVLLDWPRSIAAGWSPLASLMQPQAYSPGPEHGSGSPSPGRGFPQALWRSRQQRAGSNHL
jgi:hypothetical protein